MGGVVASSCSTTVRTDSGQYIVVEFCNVECGNDVRFDIVGFKGGR